MHLLIVTISRSRGLVFNFVSLSCVAASVQDSLLTPTGELLAACNWQMLWIENLLIWVSEVYGMQRKPSRKCKSSHRGIITDLHHLHSQEQRRATGQSHWAKLRMAHRTATKFKPPSNADTAKKVSSTQASNSWTCPTCNSRSQVRLTTRCLPLSLGLPCIADSFVASCISTECALCDIHCCK